jgi:hypothetical protein
MKPVWTKFEGDIGKDLIDAAVASERRQLKQDAIQTKVVRGLLRVHPNDGYGIRHSGGR